MHAFERRLKNPGDREEPQLRFGGKIQTDAPSSEMAIDEKGVKAVRVAEKWF